MASRPLTNPVTYGTVSGTEAMSNLDTSFGAVFTTGFNDSALGWVNYGTDIGAVNAYAVTLTATPSAYVAGMTVSMLPANSNTGASTINVNALGTVNIRNALNNPTVSGDIVSGQVVVMTYDGTSFRIVSVTPTNINLNTIYQSNRFLYDDFNLPTAFSLSTSTGFNSQIFWQPRLGGGSATASGSNTGIDATNLADGVLALSTGAVAAGFSQVYTGSLWAGLGALEMDLRFMPFALPTSLVNYNFIFGLAATTFTFNDSAVFIEGNFTGSAAQFTGNAFASSVGTATAALTWSSTNMIRIKILINSAWNSITFFAGGVQIGAAITTHIPTGVILAPIISLVSTAGSSSEAVYLDTFSMTYQYSSP